MEREREREGTSRTVLDLMRGVPLERVAEHAERMGMTIEGLVSTDVLDLDLETRLDLLREVGIKAQNDYTDAVGMLVSRARGVASALVDMSVVRTGDADVLGMLGDVLFAAAEDVTDAESKLRPQF